MGAIRPRSNYIGAQGLEYLPSEGDEMADKISEKGRLLVPDAPIIPYIQGDGIGLISEKRPVGL